ncbi:MAG: hypothetical protein MJY67_08425 [Bacteroidales bacterium]|nr:hypothetical protein [Bacteroidales bacterium]
MKKKFTGRLSSAEMMVAAIRHYGIIPFFKNGIEGWSIEELTAPDFWFFSSDQLGPWDWKIDVVREGDIAYGKFLGGKAAFATVEFYRHLMNYRRSLPKYRMALGEKFAAKSTSEKLMKYLSPVALEAIKEAGALESKDIRMICSSKITPYQIKTLGAKYKSVLTPSIKKNVIDSLVQFLQMGTWVVSGDFTRVYKGASLEYSGWQRTSLTTPDDLFNLEQEQDESGASVEREQSPFWAKMLDDAPEDSHAVDCSPEESRQYLINHVLSFFPDAESALKKMI